MLDRQLRFVHASDLHLEQPLHGVTEVPEHLRDFFVDAPFFAAERVFDTTIEEEADFLLLSGDVLQMRAGGARAMEFLWQQFHRLHEAQIPVYWCDSGLEKIDRWPSAAPLPPNVRWFAAEHVERITHRYPGGQADRRELIVYGTGSGPKDANEWEEFQHSGSAFSIAMAHTALPVEADWLSSSIDYWALGGQHQRSTVAGKPAHFCGSPQGRRPSEPGAHGCAVVEVDYRGNTQRHTVSTDVVRWHEEQLELPDHIDTPGLLRLMRDRAHALSETVGGRQALVSWLLVDGDQTTDTSADVLAGRLRQGALTGEILTALRNEFGMEVPGIWSLSLEAEPPTVLPSGWYEEDTVLGDLLRLLQQYQEDESTKIKMESLPEPHELNERLAAELMQIPPARRERLLRQVAILGVDLMRGDKILSESALP